MIKELLCICPPIVHLMGQRIIQAVKLFYQKSFPQNNQWFWNQYSYNSKKKNNLKDVVHYNFNKGREFQAEMNEIRDLSEQINTQLTTANIKEWGNWR